MIKATEASAIKSESTPGNVHRPGGNRSVELNGCFSRQLGQCSATHLPQFATGPTLWKLMPVNSSSGIVSIPGSTTYADAHQLSRRRYTLTERADVTTAVAATTAMRTGSKSG